VPGQPQTNEQRTEQVTTTTLPSPPPLPARWVDIRPLLAIGTGLWFLGYVVLLIARYGYQSVTGIWLPTCLAGWVLGLIGTSITYWQRAAARRGSRSAQQV
jgi:Na+/melibiose symporter-like transporter